MHLGISIKNFGMVERLIRLLKFYKGISRKAFTKHLGGRMYKWKTKLQRMTHFHQHMSANGYYLSLTYTYVFL